MQKSPMTTDIRIKVFSALATLVPLAACLMMSFYAMNQMSDATNQAFEDIIQATGVGETGEDVQAIKDRVRKRHNDLTAISDRNRILLLITGTVSVFVVVLMSFILVRSLQSSLPNETGGADQALTPEEVARVLERVAGEVRAGLMKKPKI